MTLDDAERMVAEGAPVTRAAAAENRARALVDEWRHMRDICGLHPAHALLTIGVGPGSMARSHERISEDVPLELKRLSGKSTAELHAALDKRTWVA